MNPSAFVSIAVSIDRDVPMPPIRHRFPFYSMKIGDSFGFPFDPGLRNTISVAAHFYAKRHPGRRFSVRRKDGEIRCWRISFKKP